MHDLDVCRICGSAEARHAVAMDAVNYVRCAGCGVERMAKYPTLAEIKAFYENGYMETKFNNLGHHIHFTPEYRSSYFAEKDMTFADIGLDLKTAKGKRLLDVGCANGQFLEYTARFGIDGAGIDISEEMVGVAQKNGLNCFVKDLFDVNEKYDLVTYWDVIEHVSDPKAILEKTRSILNTGGEVVLQTPATGMISELFGDRWLYYLPVQHIHLFSQIALFNLLNKTGFAITGWIRFGSCNPKGSIPDMNKRVADAVCKRMGIGDTMVVRARRLD